MHVSKAQFATINTVTEGHDNFALDASMQAVWVKVDIGDGYCWILIDRDGSIMREKVTIGNVTTEFDPEDFHDNPNRI